MTEYGNNSLSELLKLSEFAVITFHSTSAALKAEKKLKRSGFPFVVIPTPREISSSCGLAVRIKLEDMEQVKAYLNSEGVEQSGYYRVENRENKKIVTSLP